MSDFSMPYGAEFSPDKIDIKDVLKLSQKYSGDSTDGLVNALAEKYYKNNTTMASNCKNSMVAYEILEPGGGVSLTTFGSELSKMKKEADIYDEMAKRILIYLHGLMLIEAIRGLNQAGKQPTLEKVAENLTLMGCENLSKTNKHVPTMKKWLEKAKVLNGWKIDEKKLENLLGLKKPEIEILKDLTKEQALFLKALCNTDSDDYQDASKIRDLATAAYNITFPGKNFAAAIINPLVDKKLIEKKASASSHGGNSAKVKIIDTVKKEIISPVLSQLSTLVDKEVIKYIQKPLDELRREMDDKNKHIKGLALEAFAIKVMRIIDLDFIGTRVKGDQTSGAEVDVLFDTTRLNYARWQVQCKNTETVSLDQVAKEVGLSHVLKTNVIVMLTTGKASSTAKDYAATIMREMNLCIIFIEKDDIEEILNSPSSIVDILNRESMNAKKIKLLN